MVRHAGLAGLKVTTQPSGHGAASGLDGRQLAGDERDRVQPGWWTELVRAGARAGRQRRPRPGGGRRRRRPQPRHRRVRPGPVLGAAWRRRRLRRGHRTGDGPVPGAAPVRRPGDLADRPRRAGHGGLPRNHRRRARGAERVVRAHAVPAAAVRPRAAARAGGRQGGVRLPPRRGHRPCPAARRAADRSGRRRRGDLAGRGRPRTPRRCWPGSATSSAAATRRGSSAPTSPSRPDERRGVEYGDTHSSTPVQRR